MSRAFCIPGIIFLFCAFVLLFIVSVSLPYLTAMDITRVNFNSFGGNVAGTGATSQLRFGIWAFCSELTNGNSVCAKTGHAYALTVNSGSTAVTIGSSWTRGLAVHPVATGVTFIALLLSFSTHVTVTLLSSLVSFLAALITLIAFAIDIALFAYVKHKMRGIDQSTKTGPGFWLTFVAFILLLLASCTVCFGRRRDRMSGATSYPMAQQPGARPGLMGRFRRNRNVV
ncbi:pali-domain-containing protein [Athelia psychrophila]|uniref:Pali-domain-containing protein n=1 Tax=Athelia psychrophila TaxID=1759441 RepID=A0A165XTG0_9AGAM|nr:pali-domain-containing protein [Fibularhizoctonia sp. CBS 109695]